MSLCVCRLDKRMSGRGSGWMEMEVEVGVGCIYVYGV